MAIPLKLNTVALVAGEASGDLLASMLLKGLKARWPDARFVGIGGSKMGAQGFDSWWPMSKLSVRGYVEVLRHYREITGIRNKLKDRLITQAPDVFIGVDAPDFNLELAQHLKKRNIPTIQFVCPSIWAWRANRVKKIRESVDHVLCLFPFEPDLLHAHGIDATYIGHPLAQVIPEAIDKTAARIRLGMASEDIVLGVLPGSRISEIEQLLSKFLSAAEILSRQNLNMKVLLPMVPGLEQLIKHSSHKFSDRIQLKLINGQSHDVLAAADVALVASGTATLEAALFKCPMVIAYSMPWISWQIMKRQKLMPWVGLPNILCGEFVVPEMLQSAANPAAIANAAQEWLDQPDRVTLMNEKFQAMHSLLRKDTIVLATDAIEKILAS